MSNCTHGVMNICTEPVQGIGVKCARRSFKSAACTQYGAPPRLRHTVATNTLPDLIERITCIEGSFPSCVPCCKIFHRAVVYGRAMESGQGGRDVLRFHPFLCGRTTNRTMVKEGKGGPENEERRQLRQWRRARNQADTSHFNHCSSLRTTALNVRRSPAIFSACTLATSVRGALRYISSAKAPPSAS